jgi:glutamate synthase (NADPH/NADH) small chain
MRTSRSRSGCCSATPTDGYFRRTPARRSSREPRRAGKRAAAVGAGPASLAFAHRLAMLGHEVVIYDANPKPGGLNEYGLATYKTVDGFAQKEIDWLLSIGGIEIRSNRILGRDFTLDELLGEFGAVFLGMGLSGVNALGIAEPDARGLRDAVRFIAELRQASDYSQVPIGRKVVVIWRRHDGRGRGRAVEGSSARRRSRSSIVGERRR